MGLWSSIKKGAKKVFGGVKKVFKKIGKAAGKFFGSKLGKAILIAAAVVTAGAALYAAYGAYTTTAGTFLTKFVAGAKAFVGALASPVKSAKKMFGAAANAGQAGQAAAGIEQAGAAGEILAGGGAEVAAAPMDFVAGGGVEGLKAAGAAGQGGMMPLVGAETGVDALAGAGQGWMMPQVGAEGAAGATKGAADAGGWLAKAAKGAMNFAKSTGGGILAGQMIAGYAGGKQQEELLKEEERVRRYYDKAWQDPAQLAQLNNLNFSVDTPQGYLSRASQNPRTVRENQPDRGNTYQYGGGQPTYAPVGG